MDLSEPLKQVSPSFIFSPWLLRYPISSSASPDTETSGIKIVVANSFDNSSLILEHALLWFLVPAVG
ncbi:hypothetical protein L1987_37731 [Smallanthus sonchifolius]|uniref:Uncharacterized protein n=1 Tax=Smallanthus sonchifolius TaxID=185202 RepID=A0ACB9HJR4_9ASTR|nr:hypothetical protein L1987_37731 [Smallanthus sonchifolius]